MAKLPNLGALESDTALGAELRGCAKQVRPLVHERVVPLLCAFLDWKRSEGTAVERHVYADLDAVGLVSRLLQKRPLSIVGRSDSYLLRDGTSGVGGWESVGQDDEAPPLVLGDYVSYDEIQVGAMLGVSSPTPVVNAGARHNRGVPGAPGTFVERGVYTGLVGARFENALMESEYLVVSEHGDGFSKDGRIRAAWDRLLGAPVLTYEDAKAAGAERAIPLGGTSFLDRLGYAQRMRMTVLPFLVDASDRARAEGTTAYVHAVGLGLGVWSLCPEQKPLLVEVFFNVLATVPLPHVGVVDFSWFHMSEHAGVKSGDTITGKAGNTVRITFSSRDPFAPLDPADADKLVVASYAWDGAAFPGNEFWMGSLAGSGDPAAACCSHVAELQNATLNPERVCGEQTLVACEDGRLLPLPDVVRGREQQDEPPKKTGLCVFL